MVFGFRRKKSFVPIEEVPLRQEEQRVTGIFAKKQAKEREAKRKEFQRKVQKFRSVGKKLGKKFRGSSKLASGTLSEFGVSSQDLFFGGEERPRGKKKSKQQSKDDMFGDINTDQFF